MYYTVIIPYTAEHANRWTPTESKGPFSTLSRGAFASEDIAHEWARKHLGKAPYTVVPRE